MSELPDAALPADPDDTSRNSPDMFDRVPAGVQPSTSVASNATQLPFPAAKERTKHFLKLTSDNSLQSIINVVTLRCVMY